ncbi:MAG TPA: hypothetical protein VJU84_05170 [Pyrinomonadaceae bacterium]|nr:hypothetical protein [Pyrinomonadaceae bacterium]
MKATMTTRALPRIALLISVPVATMTFLWLTRSNDVSLIQWSLSLGLLFLPWQAYLNWRRRGRPELPLFGMIAFMYFLYYAVPMFWGDLSITTDFAPRGQQVSDSGITEALALALIGIGSLGLGMRVGLGRLFTPRNLEVVGLKPGRLSYVRIVLVAGSLLGVSDTSTYIFGAGGRQAVVLLISLVPLLAFAILFRIYLKGEASRLDKFLIAAFLTARFLAGMSSGWLNVFTSILIICAALYIAEKKKIPRLALVVVVAFTLFFQVGKEDFRKTYWSADQQPASRVERLQFWTDTSLKKWNEAIDDPTGETLKGALSPSVNRLSLLTQTANVIDQTPAVVPYQYGELYSYMFITLIPRFVWPDKPSANDANQFYQVAYGLTREENLEGVSIGVGVLTEGYISFGWPGALGIMFLLGAFFDFFQRTFLSKSSGQLLISLGVVLLPQFLTIESQLAQYLGGIIQQVLFTLIIMLPAMSLRRRLPQMPLPKWRYARES